MAYQPTKGALRAALLAIAALPSLAAGADAVIQQNFAGLGLAQVKAASGFGVIPSDMGLAVGQDHVAQMVNGAFAIYQKNGALAQPVISDAAFWENAGISSSTLSARVTDPRLAYDAQSRRWFASEVTTSATGNQVLLARSNTSDPTQGFKAVQFTGNSGFADFPTLGVDRDGVYIGTNNFTSSTGSFTGVSLFSIPKADLIGASPSVAQMTRFDNLSAAQRGFTLQGISNNGGGSASVLAVDALSWNTVDRTAINGAAGPGATLSATDKITGVLDGAPNAARQPDGTRNLDAGDRRLSASVVQAGDYIYATRTIGDSQNSTATTHDMAAWLVLDAATNAILRQGVIGDPLYDYYYPSIAADDLGNFVIGFNRSGDPVTGAAGDISAYAVACTGFGADCGDPLLLAEGLVGDYHLTYGGSANRWGDYSATVLDPVDPDTFWTALEIPLAANEWGTQVTALRLAGVPLPEPAAWGLMLAGLGGWRLAIRRRRGERVA